MKINQENYEQYFLDYAEGNLSPEMEEELKLFLESHPELQSVLESYECISLSPSEIKNNNLKNRLKKNIRPTIHIDEAHVDEWLISETEGLLTEQEKAELNEFLAMNPAYEYDRKTYGLTKVLPDTRINYPQKNQLKRKIPVFPLNRLAWLTSVAAALILILISVRYFLQPEIIETPQVIPTAVKPVAEAQPVTEMKPVSEVKPLDDAKKGMESASWRMESLRMESASWRMESLQANPLEPQKPDLALYDFTPVSLDIEKKENPLIAKVFGNIIIQTRDAIRGNKNIKKIRNTDIDIWDIAEAGVKGFGTVTDRDLELLVRRDKEGRIKSYALVENDRLLVTKSRDNN